MVEKRVKNAPKRQHKQQIYSIMQKKLRNMNLLTKKMLPLHPNFYKNN